MRGRRGSGGARRASIRRMRGRSEGSADGRPASGPSGGRPGEAGAGRGRGVAGPRGAARGVLAGAHAREIRRCAGPRRHGVGPAPARSGPHPAGAVPRAPADPGRSARGPDTQLADHDAASLAELLCQASGTASAARSVAGKVVRRAFGAEPARRCPRRPGTPGALAALGVGAWAHEALLALNPARRRSRSPSGRPRRTTRLRLVLRARGGALIESVLIPGPARTTLCVSSQVGCARACSFCEDGAARARGASSPPARSSIRSGSRGRSRPRRGGAPSGTSSSWGWGSRSITSARC